MKCAANIWIVGFVGGEVVLGIFAVGAGLMVLGVEWLEEGCFLWDRRCS